MSAVAELIETESAVHRHEPLSRYTSWRVGGPADLFFRPKSYEALGTFLASLPDVTPVSWIGLGSNLLIRDGGVRGAVICTSGLPKTFDASADGRVEASAALPCATLAKRCARLALGPAAFFAGIPGSLGGALAMNAGAFGGETWDSIESVDVMDRKGVVRMRRRNEFTVGYRSVQGAVDEWFVGARFVFSPEQSAEAERIRVLLRERSDRQPLGQPSAGSVFRNPEGAYAGEFIEQAGLKGRRHGGAMVSEKHGNFIINTGSATASDIEALIEEVRASVLEATGIELQCEVHILGEQELPA